jgi:3-oxoacyl-[acyl-carrier protein] reductase
VKTNTKKLNGKVAIVTGASKGIGAAIARHLASEGAAVVVNYASSKEGADRVVDKITKQGEKAIAVRANMAKKAEIERLFSETKKAFGGLDISSTMLVCMSFFRWRRSRRNISTGTLTSMCSAYS